MRPVCWYPARRLNTVSSSSITSSSGPRLVSPKILADVFNSPVYLKTVPDAAAIGAALRAKHGFLCRSARDGEREGGCSVEGSSYVPFSCVLDDKGGRQGRDSGGSEDTPVAQRAGFMEGLRLAASPRADAEALYEGMAER